MPSLAVVPLTVDDVCASLAAAHDAGAAVVPWGGGTHQSRGNAPTRYDLALDLHRLDRLIEHEPADLTVTIEAGMTLKALQQTLGASGQWLPLDPPCAPEATVGGVLAVDASGPSRYSRGTARDLVIGMSVVTADGQLVKSGGRVVKNVAGYDMAKLHIGAHGTLGVIVQASFKVAPLPVTTRLVTLTGPVARLMSSALLVRDKGLACSALVLNADPTTARLHVRLAGGSAAVDRSHNELVALSKAEGLTLTDGESAAWDDALRPATSPADDVVARCGAIPTATGAVIEALTAAGASVCAYPTIGAVYGRWAAGAVTSETLTKLRVFCVDTAKGALVLESAPPELKRVFDVWGDPRGDFDLMRRLKAELDPRGVLNPGRFVGGL